MLKPSHSNGKHFYNIFLHPVSRVLKFNAFRKNLSKVEKGGIVLDYGAGDRPYESMLLEHFKKYISADYAPANEAHAQRPDIFIDEHSIKMEDSQVDCVVLTEVMEHLYDPKTTLSEIHRVLKPGGVLIGTVPFAINEHEQPYDFHRYTFFCLDRMFRESGFEVKHLDYIGDLLGVAILNVDSILLFPRKIFNRLGLKPLAFIWQLLIRWPEYLYFLALKAGLNPQKIQYFKQYPLGFVFHLEKREDAYPKK